MTRLEIITVIYEECHNRFVAIHNGAIVCSEATLEDILDMAWRVVELRMTMLPPGQFWKGVP